MVGGGVAMLERFTVMALLASMATLWICFWLLRIQWKREQKGMAAYKDWLMKKVKEAEKKAKSSVEQRCQHCVEGPECPGYNTGVVYPCQYYEEREEHGSQKQHPQHPLFGRVGGTDRPAGGQDLHREI